MHDRREREVPRHLNPGGIKSAYLGHRRFDVISSERPAEHWRPGQEFESACLATLLTHYSELLDTPYFGLFRLVLQGDSQEALSPI